MSAERPAAGGQSRLRPKALPPEPEAVGGPAEAEATLAEHTIQPTRTSMVWTMVGIGPVLLGKFIEQGRSQVAFGYDLEYGLMIAAGLVELVLGVEAEPNDPWRTLPVH